MNRICLLFSLLVLFSCSDKTNVGSLKDITWLEGSWVNTTSKVGMITKEIWSMEGDRMVGQGLVIKSGDTTFVENLSLKMVNDTLSYVADVAHNANPVAFKLTKTGIDSWVFENADHDFPKSIGYIRTSQGFEAVVSGGGKSFKLNFKRD